MHAVGNGLHARLYWPPEEGATSAFDTYPEAVLALVPELREPPLVTEPRATCDRCALAPLHSGAKPEHPWAFDPVVRCCTFNPAIPNFLVGRALSRGGVSEERIRARLVDRVGVGSWGIRPSDAWVEDYTARHHGAFGRDTSLKCPYWVPGPHGCGIWHDRNHVCRTWFCKHDGGVAARDWWRGAKNALVAAETLLADLCADEGKAPADDADIEAWVAYFKWCALRVDAVSPSDLEKLRHPELKRRRQIVDKGPEYEAPVGDVVVTSATTAEKDGNRAWIAGYSGYDVVSLPFAVFRFFSLLDGKRTWREALAETNAVASPGLDEADVAELIRVGAVRNPRAGDVPGTEGDDPDMREVEAGVFIAFRTPST